MKLIPYIIIILLTACILSCGDKNVSENTTPVSSKSENVLETTEEWVPDDYKTSELAELMRTMHTDHLLLKSKIEEGELNMVKSSDYSFIHEAIPTDSNDSTPLFHVYAKAYLLADKAIYNSKTSSEYKNSFNIMVNSCIGCHQNFCMGPIPKIELLRIPK